MVVNFFLLAVFLLSFLLSFFSSDFLHLFPFISPLHYSVSSFLFSLFPSVLVSILPTLFASSSLLAMVSYFVPPLSFLLSLSLYLQVHPFLSRVTVILSAESSLFPSRFSDTRNLSWYFGA